METFILVSSLITGSLGLALVAWSFLDTNNKYKP